ncbi:flagellar hook protein FlgE [Buchnera aphidicola (Aphis helianthi)]|uniref:Flagellar hook protein FlgE n=1 Tax=Buchnera aphidicola (Aphis helianthi) TaxID=2315802 RepID=A0A4D6XQM1_9GAMM|nr:flagellar hook protein FlgE [Buchnera aphidicola]QCI17158.1 flagellar hook protein FlgE [Buchnera aphidicola (Aphis helianthi)]
MSTMEAISGLMANSNNIDVVSNNVANASTVGFKSSTLSFFDIISNSFYSNRPIGSGVGIANTRQNFSNGVLMQTGRDLDLGIVQDGFFRVLNSKGYVYYTRNGQFLLDKDKNIITMDGMYLTGQNQCNFKNNLNNISKLEPINLKNSDVLQSKPTTEIKLNADLIDNANSSNTITGSNDHITNIETNNITVYDQDGKAQNITISIDKQDNEWIIKVKSNNVNNSNDEKIDDTIHLKFDSQGKLISDSTIKIKSKNFKNLTLDIKCTLKQSENHNSTIQLSQNGYPKGLLKSFEILNNGEILGQYTNQRIEKIGQIFLSKFMNPEKLKPESGNIWSATQESGNENIGIAGDKGFGIMISKTLESSNVDLNKELINMIVAQRNYQSSAQAFKTEDKIIGTLINLR